ncbi:Nn.00g085160.m01.CDS01 [Neocucurbitaria sp. VM-36]
MNISKYIPEDQNLHLTDALQYQSDNNVLRHFLGFPILGAQTSLNEAAVVCLDAEWWQKDPKPITELGVAELMSRGITPSVHAENILTGIRVAHARIMPYAHLQNTFPGAGDPEQFHFGTSKFVTLNEAKQVLINTFVRPRQYTHDGELQPIILIGHAVENDFDHIKQVFGIDLRSYGTIVKVIDTQVMAQNAGIKGPNGPYISLKDLLAHFNIHIDVLHTAGNDAAGTLIAAVLIALKDALYPHAIEKPPATVRGRNIQDVVQWVMDIGTSLPSPPWGRELFCTRCDRDNHVRADCFARLECTICQKSGVMRLFNARRTHSTAKCLYRYQDLRPPDHPSYRP